MSHFRRYRQFGAIRARARSMNPTCERGGSCCRRSLPGRQSCERSRSGRPMVQSRICSHSHDFSASRALYDHSNPYTSIVARAPGDSLRHRRGTQNHRHLPIAGGAGRGVRATRRHRRRDHGGAARGLIRSARIVPPTSQNQACIEDDLRDLIPGIVQGSQAEVTRACEVAIRTYDPCISCSTHFLKLEIARC
jgi:hypothetical protein